MEKSNNNNVKGNSTNINKSSNNSTDSSNNNNNNIYQQLIREQQLPFQPDQETMSDYIVRRLGRRAGKRTERSNIHITREIFDRMSLTPFIASIPVVHVAGTKGKGSTSALTAQLLRSSNNFKKVALFQSPHLVDIRERVLINNEFIGLNQFMDLFHQFEKEFAEQCNPIFGALPPSQQQQQEQQQIDEIAANDSNSNNQQMIQMIEDKTHFFRSIFAFSVFVMKCLAVDAAVIEVGIGGRLDPTNIIPPPTCCVVTCLGMDHTDILGPTIESIASEKAGIYKRGAGACLSAPQSDYPQTRKVLEQFADEAAGQQVIYPTPKDFLISSSNNNNKNVFDVVAEHKGAHMAENAALALAASRIVGLKSPSSSSSSSFQKQQQEEAEVKWNSFPLTEIEEKTLIDFKLDGRSQKIAWTPKNNSSNSNSSTSTTTFLIDGAHTVESIRRAITWALNTTTTTISTISTSNNNNNKLTIVFGTSRPPGPQLEEIMALARGSDRIAEFIFINIPELLSGRDSAAKCSDYFTTKIMNHKDDANNNIKFKIADCAETALEGIHKEIMISGNDNNNRTILVVGSMYSAGGALKYLRENGSCTDL